MSASLDVEKLRRHVLSHEELRDAIAYVLNKNTGVPREEAEKDAGKMSNYILDFFGYSDRIIDNVLESSDRGNFYMMEDEKILSTDREEVNLLKGKVWRIKYWMLNKRKILEFAEAYQKGPVEEDLAKVYQNGEITDGMWKREEGQISEGTDG